MPVAGKGVGVLRAFFWNKRGVFFFLEGGLWRKGVFLCWFVFLLVWGVGGELGEKGLSLWKLRESKYKRKRGSL